MTVGCVECFKNLLQHRLLSTKKQTNSGFFVKDAKIPEILGELLRFREFFIFENHIKNRGHRMENRINREDMLELTRRMTVARTSFTRIAGCYVDEDGEYDGSFNTNFLKLSQAERKKNLELAKAIPFSETNVQLKKYRFRKEYQQAGSMWQLFMAMKSCGLKNDALMETFYDVIMENYVSKEPYGIFVFHDRYDVPVKGTDKERQGESEEVFEYIICGICPLKGEYEPEKPIWGFLFPAFTDRSADINSIAVFRERENQPEEEFLQRILKI